MDWRYFLFTAEQGLLGLAPLVVALPILLFAAQPGRRLASCSPVVTAVAMFAISCVLAAIPNIEDSGVAGFFPSLGLFLTVVFLIPSTLALRRWWFGAAHILTLAGALLSWLVASMAIAHDWL